MRKVPLVEISSWLRRPLIAWPEDRFGLAFGVDIGGVEHVESGVQADVDHARGLGDRRGAPGLEKLSRAAETCPYRDSTPEL